MSISKFDVLSLGLEQYRNEVCCKFQKLIKKFQRLKMRL